MTSEFLLHKSTYVCVYSLQSGDFQLAAKILGARFLLQALSGSIGSWNLENSFRALGWLVGNAF
jgi:hypothetical protein